MRFFLGVVFALAIGVTADAAKLAVIFKGPTIDRECVRNMTAMAKHLGYNVRFVKPGQTTTRLLKRATLYIVPGGEDVDDLKQVWTPSERRAIRRYILRGGRYVGVCLGGNWAATNAAREVSSA